MLSLRAATAAADVRGGGRAAAAAAAAAADVAAVEVALALIRMVVEFLDVLVLDRVVLFIYFLS